MARDVDNEIVGLPSTNIEKIDEHNSAIESIDARISISDHSQLPDLIRARQAILNQEEGVRDGSHRRWGERANFFAKIGFSVVAGVLGTYFIMNDSPYLGLFVLGGAMAIYVPKYVQQFLKRGNVEEEV